MGWLADVLTRQQELGRLREENKELRWEIDQLRDAYAAEIDANRRRETELMNSVLQAAKTNGVDVPHAVHVGSSTFAPTLGVEDSEDDEIAGNGLPMSVIKARADAYIAAAAAEGRPYTPEMVEVLIEKLKVAAPEDF